MTFATAVVKGEPVAYVKSESACVKADLHTDSQSRKRKRSKTDDEEGEPMSFVLKLQSHFDKCFTGLRTTMMEGLSRCEMQIKDLADKVDAMGKAMVKGGVNVDVQYGEEEGEGVKEGDGVKEGNGEKEGEGEKGHEQVQSNVAAPLNVSPPPNVAAEHVKGSAPPTPPSPAADKKGDDDAVKDTVKQVISDVQVSKKSKPKHQKKVIDNTRKSERLRGKVVEKK